jgi:hypothetical protein
MSGALSHQLAQAAGTIALRAEAASRGLTLGHIVAERARKTLAAREGREAETQAGRTWREMNMRTRTVLVMLASEQEGDPRSIAMQPWASFSSNDQCAMGAAARTLADGLKRATYLR